MPRHAKPTTQADAPYMSTRSKKEPQYYCLVVSFIRHGEYDGNIDISSTATKLNERGKRQASYLGKQWERVRIDRLFSSTEERAVQTACILASWNVNRPTVRKERRLVEQAYGKKVMKAFIDGKEDQGYKLLWGTSATGGVGSSFDYRPPGGESYNDVIARGKPFIKAILQKYGVRVDQVSAPKIGRMAACKPETLIHGVPHVVVVSHNIFLSLIWETLKHWTGGHERVGNYHWDNTSWSRVVLYWDSVTDKLYCVDMKLPIPD